jgi:hypothetical protein
LRFKNPILGIAFVLLGVLATFFVFSFTGNSIRVFNTELKKPGIRSFLFEKEPVKQPQPVANNVPGTLPKTATNKRTVDTSSQRILMVGESMIEGLMFPFMHYAKYNHHTLKAKIWYGSRIIDWGASDTLKKMIADFKPTYIIISIAANELFVRNVEEREPALKKIIAQMDGYKYIWIGPPNPKKDNGINDMIKRNVGEGQFFMSKYMQFDRRRDGVHPVPEGSRKWADSIAVWIMDKSKYPIQLKKEGTDSTLNAALAAKSPPGPVASIHQTRKTRSFQKPEKHHRRRRRH